MALSAIRVLPAPHSATTRTALPLRRYFEALVMTSACAGSTLRSNELRAGATGSPVLWSGVYVPRIRSAHAGPNWRK